MSVHPSIEDILYTALAKESAAERAIYLSEVCGDDAGLRDEVESLLAVHESGVAFLERPVIDGESLPSTADLAERPGAVIGRYKLLQEIGEGGFGAVFMAEQNEPVTRKVALKVIKLGMDTKQVIARFEAERQALAMMDHPNIAKVLDAGATETGRPFFVMELVRGVPITDYCDKNNLPTKERLELFVGVCHAIQHAHQKGIIHRDIKPSNVMVTLHDGRPVIKVIDFGVSKALHQKLTERTLFTAYGQMVGTPQYMSPEQAEMSGLDIDTRSDVYSLGILLYELLTGTTPLESRALRRASYAEIQRLIREEEAPRPSRRLSSLGNRLSVIAKDRSVSPKRLQHIIRGELDWIVIRSLEKDRARRYETANGFAADVERYLNNEPVEASPPSAAYRFRAFARRNRTMLATAALVAVALLLGSIVSVRFAVVARQERQRSEDLRYRSDISGAMAALNDRDFGRVRQLLREHHPSYRNSDGQDRRGWGWYHLWLACKNRDKTPTIRHEGFVTTLTISPDGRTLVSGDTTGYVSVWDIATHELLDRKTYRGNVWSVEFSPDGSMLATGGDESAIRLWKMDPIGRTLIEAARLPTNSSFTFCMAFSTDGKQLASCGNSTVIQLWDVHNQEAIQELEAPGRAFALAFHPEGKSLAAHCHEEVAIWKLPYDPDERPSTISCGVSAGGWTGLAFSPDGRTIAASWKSDGVQLCNVADGTIIHRLIPTTPAIVSSLDFSRDGTAIAVGDHDKTVAIWDTESGKEIVRSRGHHSNVICCVRFTPDGRTLASSSWDKTVRLWRVEEQRPPLVRHDLEVDKVAFSTDGKWLVTLGREGKMALLEAKTWQTLREFDGHLFALDDDGTLLAVSNEQNLQLWDLGPRPIRLLHKIPVFAKLLAFSSNGNLAVAGGDSLQLWDPGQPTKPIVEYAESDDFPAHRFFEMAFSPDGQTLAIVDGRGDLALLDENLTVLDRKQGELAFGAKNLTFSPDGHYLVTPYYSNSVKVWDVRQRKLKACEPLDDHTDSAVCAAFSQSGLLAIGCANGQVKLWDSETWTKLATLHCHDNDRGVDSIAFSVDGYTLVTGGADGTVRIFRAASPQEVIEAERRGIDPLSID